MPPTEPIGINCPLCRNQRIWKDGVRQTGRGEVQRYICRDCGTRFSQTTWNGSDESEHLRRVHTTALYSDHALLFNRQVGVTETQGAKNLAEVESRIEKRAAGATKTGPMDPATIKGKIVEFAFWMDKEGYDEETASKRAYNLKRIADLGANLWDPEDVKKVIAKHQWKDSYKRNLAYAYETFLTMEGLTWNRPHYQRTESYPFIPTEAELDQLIASCSKKVGTFLQGLKDTGADPGELAKLRWIDVNVETRTVNIQPIKGHNPRILPVSPQLIDRLARLPKNSEYVFNYVSLQSDFYQQRKVAAYKLANPRILKISLTTFRHWKGTMEYHKTKDPYHVKKLLGHKSMQSTEIYINIEQALFNTPSDEFHVKVATNVEEACKLVEVGFEYVTGEYNDGGKIFRKRK